MKKNMKRILGATLLATMIFSGSALAGTTMINYDFICPRGGSWDKDPTSQQKTTNGDGLVRLTSSTENRQVQFHMTCRAGNGADTGLVSPQHSAILERGNVSAGRTTWLGAHVPTSQAGIHATTIRGSWRAD